MPRTKPTAKQKAFINNYIRTRNITQSAKAVYNVKNDVNAACLGRKTLQSPAVQNYISEVLDNTGLRDTDLSRFLREIIIASASERALKKATPSDGLRGLEMVFRLKDRFPAERKRIEKTEFKINLQTKSTKELQELLDKTIKEVEEFKKLMARGNKSWGSEVSAVCSSMA